MLEQGFLLVLWGHAYYGRYAYNLAVSIKAVEPETQITVVHHGRSLAHLSERQKAIFDNIIDMPEGIDPGYGTKLYINELSPYEHTIFLDADTVWLPRRKPSELFKELREFDFSGITEGHYDIATGVNHGNTKYYYWADPEEIISTHKVKNNFYQWRTELMYFKKNGVTDKLFKTARKIYANPRLKSMRRFAHTIPDELALNVAAGLCDVHPHVYKWQPTYWPAMFDQHVPDFESLYGHYLLSCGSNRASGALKGIYNRVMKAACYKLGVQYLFNLHSKTEFDSQRAKM